MTDQKRGPPSSPSPAYPPGGPEAYAPPFPRQQYRAPALESSHSDSPVMEAACAAAQTGCEALAEGCALVNELVLRVASAVAVCADDFVTRLSRPRWAISESFEPVAQRSYEIGDWEYETFVFRIKEPQLFC